MTLPVPAPYGIVEITPEREYLIVLEFVDGPVKISQAQVDDGIIDEGQLLVRKLWEAGPAHRDIKPGNLMVRAGRVLLVDAFFVRVRPSPWRQAVDLGNMMLVLAVGSDPERVYQRACGTSPRRRSPRRSRRPGAVASPSQRRMVVKQDGRDLINAFRRLAPQRRPIAIQRWSVRRVVLAVGLLAWLLRAAGVTYGILTPLRGVATWDPPACTPQSSTVLVVQTVPAVRPAAAGSGPS